MCGVSPRLITEEQYDVENSNSVQRLYVENDLVLLLCQHVRSLSQGQPLVYMTSAWQYLRESHTKFRLGRYSGDSIQRSASYIVSPVSQNLLRERHV